MFVSRIIYRVRTLITIILFVFLGQQIKAQELKILDINTDEYPVISSRFVLTTESNSKVTDLKKEEIYLNENTLNREIIYLKNPEIKAMPLSILLVFDISGSMKTNRMRIAQEAALGLINEVDLSSSEIAISTFNYSAFLNCDFTHDSSQLVQAIENLNSSGGTSYEDAFMSDLTGGIEIAKQGKNKKIIIFMTDGLGNANSDTIINLATKEDITIFTTTIELEMPPVLKKISKETGGYYFGQVNDPKTSKTIYSKLYHDIVATEYGVMKWMVADDCEDIHHVDIKTRGLSSNSFFELPVDSIEGLVVIPSSLFVRSQEKDSMTTKFIRIASPHKPITISNIVSSNTDKLTIDKPDFPLVLRPGDNYQLKINYAVKGTPEEKLQLKIYTENCLQRNNIDIQYGIPGKIEVIRPAKGDIYGAGMDTVIEWIGISKSQPVALYYKYGNINWQKITETKGLKYTWETPYDTSTTYQIMAKPADATDFVKKYEIPGQIRDVRIMDVSNDGNLFITQDVVGMISVWENSSLRPVKSFRNQGSKFIYFSKDDLFMIIYNTHTITVKNIFTDAQNQPIYKENYKIFAAHPTLYGDEFLLPSEVRLKAKNISEFKDAITSEVLFELNHDENAPLYAAKCEDAQMVLFMNRDYSLDIYDLKKHRTKRLTRKDEIVTRAYINPNGKFVYAEQADWRGIIETNRGKPVIKFGEESYIRFSPDGNRLLTINKMGQLNLWDIVSQTKLGTFPHASLFNFSHKGNMFYMVHDNTITLFDINKGYTIHKIVTEDIRDISISQDGSEILATSNGKAEIYDCASGGLKFTIVNHTSPITKAVFAENDKIITINQDKSIAIWEPSLSPESGLSGEFSIVSPLPKVTPEYNLGSEIVSDKKEVILEKFMTNNSMFPIKILDYQWGDFTDNYELVSNPPPFTLKPQDTINVEIRFLPSDTISFPTSINVVTPGGNVESKITGNGISKKYLLQNRIIDFGKIEWNTSKDTLVELIRNISNEIITINSIQNNGPDTEQFSIVKNIKDVPLNPGENLKTKLSYTALRLGRASGSLDINIDNQQILVQLFGEGLGAREVFIRGNTIDQDSNVIQSKIVCTEINAKKEIFTTQTDTFGNFSFPLFTAGNYINYAEKDGYISASENFEVTSPFLKDTIDITIMLSKIQNGTLFRLNGVFFEFAKAELIPSSKTDLNRVLKLLKENSELKLEIHGHTDEIGTEDDNMELSKARALSVKKYLVENGISESRIFIQYFGETKPLAPNNTDSGRQLNRRVEFLIKE